jgi:hypothetical protein
MPRPRSEDPYGRLRQLLLLILAVATAGTGVELGLLGHYETVWQWTPIAVFAMGLAATAVVLVRPRRGGIRLFQAVMGLFIAAGALGLYLHYRGNAEFELEMVPSLHGFELFWEAIRGATPALAPGTMVQLGLLGLATTYRHPLLRRSTELADSTEEDS